MKKILFLEDDEVLAESLIELLEAENFAITHVCNGEEVLEKTLTKEFLLEELSFADKEMSDGSLRVHINKLRKLSLPITTIKGVGYRLSSS